jgi:3-hydroxybutyryl-CoA dehydratase
VSGGVQVAGSHFEDYEPGQSFVSRGRTVTDADIRLFVGATNCDHPNHTDAEYCRAHPIFDRPCAQGVLVLGLLDGFLAEVVTTKMEASLNYGHDKVRYLKPTYIDDTVHAEIEVTECVGRDEQWGVVHFDARAVNQDGETVLYESHLVMVTKRGAEV